MPEDGALLAGVPMSTRFKGYEGFLGLTTLLWLACAHGVRPAPNLAGARVGPFPCANGQSRARTDCAGAPFAACATPGLGSSSGECRATTGRESFRYSVQFTTNQHGVPEPTCTRPVCRELLAAIEGATQSVDFALYGIRSQSSFIDALVAAQARGVTVRGVVDSENADCTKFGYPDTPRLVRALRPGSVICDTGPGFGDIMHNKFLIIDHAKVWTGSTNISDTELGGEYNTDVAVLIGSRELAAIYATEFDEMFRGSFHRRKTDNTVHVLDGSHFTDGSIVKSYFSPTDDARDHAVLPLLASAKKTVDIAMFYFTSQPIAEAILAAKARGVTVRMVLDAGGASHPASKHRQLCAASIEVKTENWGGKSHSKWAVSDHDVPGAAAVVFGSMNWTEAGNVNNDENTLYIRNDGFAAEFHREFERQWADLASVPPCKPVSVEGADSSACSPRNDCTKSCTSGSCCDGVDNDYDRRTDLEEEACACADGIDNDGDGYVDGDDFDCKVVNDLPE